MSVTSTAKTTRTAINQLTTPALSFEDSLAVYAEAGFPSIGLWEATLENDYTAALNAWRQTELRCASATPSQASILWSDRVGGPRDLDLRVEEIRAAIERLAAFQPACVVLITGPCRLRNRLDAHNAVVRALSVLGDAAARSGTRVALEPIHPSLEGFSYVSGIRDSLDIIEAVGHPAVGLMCDLFHIWDIPDVEADIAAAGYKIFGVQVSDWREPQRSWSDRVLPGDGVAPLPALVRATEASGYRGDYELEIMSDDGRYELRLEDSLWVEAPKNVARRGFTTLSNLLTEAAF